MIIALQLCYHRLIRTTNAVGYNTITINKEYTLLTVNFTDASGADMTVNQAFPYAEGMTAGKTYTTADNIQVMTADGGYTTYFLSNGDYGKSSHSAELENKWAKMGETVATADKFPVGGGAWYLSRSKAGTLKFNNPIGQ